MNAPNEERAAQLAARGANAVATATVDVDTTVGGTVLTAGLTSPRVGLKIAVPSNASGVLYVSVGGTPTAAEHSYELFPGDVSYEPVADGVEVKALASTGSIAVRCTEYGVTP